METRKRKDVKKEETWALEDLYQNEDACREDARLLEEELKAFTARKGTLHSQEKSCLRHWKLTTR